MVNRFTFCTVLMVLLGLSAPLAAQTTFTFSLSPGQEVPPVVSGASGVAHLHLDAAGTALTYTILLTGLDLDGLQTADPGDDVVAMHFHNAPAGFNGPVVFGMISPGHDLDDLVINPVAGTVSGSWEESDNNGNQLLSAQMANLLAGDLYINVHTVAFPGGEVRGQVLEAQPSTPVPTLGMMTTSVLILLLAAMGLVLLRRTGAKSRSV